MLHFWDFLYFDLEILLILFSPMLHWIFTTLLNHLWEQYGMADVTIMEIVADNKIRYTGEHCEG